MYFLVLANNFRVARSVLVLFWLDYVLLIQFLLEFWNLNDLMCRLLLKSSWVVLPFLGLGSWLGFFQCFKIGGIALDLFSMNRLMGCVVQWLIRVIIVSSRSRYLSFSNCRLTCLLNHKEIEFNRLLVVLLWWGISIFYWKIVLFPNSSQCPYGPWVLAEYEQKVKCPWWCKKIIIFF